jgi:hypothetical protein
MGAIPKNILREILEKMISRTPERFMHILGSITSGVQI